MIDVDRARIAAHQRNLMRYRRILATPLTETERAYVKRRIAEERARLEMLEHHVTAPTPATALPAQANPLTRL